MIAKRAGEFGLVFSLILIPLASSHLPGISQPETFEEAGSRSKEAGKGVLKESASAFRDIVAPAWRETGEWLQGAWGSILSWIRHEAEDRNLYGEFEREKKEVAEDLEMQTKKARESLWERFLRMFEVKLDRV